MEITKMMSLSTGHISENTRKLLDAEPEENNLVMTVYPKSEYGWFIYIGNLDDKQANRPADLMACVALAKKHDCIWLCFDCDVEPVENLPQYD